MLATPGPLPHGPDASSEWAFEVKWDGMRALATRHDARWRLASRSGSDISDRFPEVAAALPADLGPGTVLDGEIVAFDDLGRPSFSVLAPRIQGRGERAGSPPVTFLVFDLVHDGADDLLAAPYSQRRERLVARVPRTSRVQVPDVFDDGPALLSSTLAGGLEGVVAKRRASLYRPGVRSSDWVKVAHRRTRSYVVGGWKRGVDSGLALASLLVGTPTGDGLLEYDGAVGSGLNARVSAALLPVLRDLVRDDPPFHAHEGLPSVTRDGVTWVEPFLVADVEHLGRAGQGLLRQPSLVRLRPDLGYDDVLRDGATS
jgi:bifunctional non-homologous end joining protein LigD